MNANELAEIIQHLENAKYVGASKAATMLRQQKAEIEALKNELKRYADAIGEERGNKALRNHEIAEILTKVLDDCGLLKKETL
jgi:UDP-N-acetylglucosamine:LPS N-acetylglucosamine transferase